MPESSE